MILILLIVGILIGIPLFITIHGNKNIDLDNDPDIPIHD